MLSRVAEERSSGCFDHNLSANTAFSGKSLCQQIVGLLTVEARNNETVGHLSPNSVVETDESDGSDEPDADGSPPMLNTGAA